MSDLPDTPIDGGEQSCGIKTAEAQSVVVPCAASTSCGTTSPDLKDKPEAGDFVVLWASYQDVRGLVLQSGAIFNGRLGSFHHDDLIGKPFGTKVKSRKGDSWMAMLRPTPELITQSVQHRTQIIYHADISLILTLLDARPGKIIVESGTGSGSVSVSFARAVAPGGKLHTFEFHEDRKKQAAADFERYGVQDIVCSHHGDACKDGFGSDLDNKVDGVFLDLPTPWLAMPHVERCLVHGGKLCTFSPCIEQVEKVSEALRQRKWHDIRAFETLAVNWGVKPAEAPQKKRRTTAGGKAAIQKAPSGAADSKQSSSAPASASPQDDADCQEEAAARAEGATETLDTSTGRGSPQSWLSYQMPMRGHTGYLLVGTRPPPDEP